MGVSLVIIRPPWESLAGRLQCSARWPMGSNNQRLRSTAWTLRFFENTSKIVASEDSPDYILDD